VSVTIDSAVTVWDPHYLDNNKRGIVYPEWIYTFNYTDVDYVSYPLDGIIFETALTRRGIDADMNMWQLSTRLTRSWPLAYKLWFGFQNINILKWPLSQPFYNQGLIGYADVYLRGLDRYVVDGTAGSILRNTLYRELFNFNIPFSRGTSHDHIPIASTSQPSPTTVMPTTAILKIIHWSTGCYTPGESASTSSPFMILALSWTIALIN